MCWNAEVSLNTFIFAIIGMIIVVGLNKISYTTILFALSISLMQLLEYYTWNNINDKDIIFKLSIIGFLIILFQILILNYGLLQGDEKIIALIIIIIYSLFIFIYNYQNDKFKMEKGENGHLIWHYVDIPLPLLIIVFFFYIYPSIKYSYMSIFIMIIPLLISLYYYYNYKTWGTMWCYFSNIYWLVLIILSFNFRH